MATITQNLIRLRNIRNALKDSIAAKGVDPQGSSFADLAGLVNQIKTMVELSPLDISNLEDIAMDGSTSELTIDMSEEGFDTILNKIIGNPIN